MIYLDHAATTPVCPAAVEAAVQAMTAGFGNPSSQYPLGREAARRREEDRAVVAGALGCEAQELFFTSCGTEGDNWAVRAAVALGKGRGRHIVTTAIEHDAVRRPMAALEREGYEVTYLKPDRAGNIDPHAVMEAVRQDTILVSIMLVNNEVGSVLPVRAAREAIDRAGAPALLHTDAVQGFLKVPFSPAGLGCDLATICAHKIRGPKGIGGLYIKRSLIPKMEPLLLGGGQEGGLRPGTEATAQIAAFAAAVRAWPEDAAQTIRAVRDYAARRLGAIDGVELITDTDTAAPHILALSLPAFSGETLVRVLGDRGVYLSSGSACHRGKPSHVFQAMPLAPQVRYGALRVSFGVESTREDVDALAALLEQVCRTKSLLL